MHPRKKRRKKRAKIFSFPSYGFFFLPPLSPFFGQGVSKEKELLFLSAGMWKKASVFEPFSFWKTNRRERRTFLPLATMVERKETSSGYRSFPRLVCLPQTVKVSSFVCHFLNICQCCSWREGEEMKLSLCFPFCKTERCIFTQHHFLEQIHCGTVVGHPSGTDGLSIKRRSSKRNHRHEAVHLRRPISDWNSIDKETTTQKGLLSALLLTFKAVYDTSREHHLSSTLCCCSLFVVVLRGRSALLVHLCIFFSLPFPFGHSFIKLFIFLFLSNPQRS